MTNALVEDFEWEVDGAGYEWVTVSHQTEVRPSRDRRKYVTFDVLTRRERNRTAQADRRYTPFTSEHASLFRVFAATQPTREGVLPFAERYGLLGLGKEEPEMLVLFDRATCTTIMDPNSVDRKRISIGESLAEPRMYADCWTGHIKRMRFALELWDASCRRDTTLLAQYVRWMRNGVQCRRTASGPLFGIASGTTIRDWKRDDLIVPAREFVRTTIKMELSTRCALDLRWNRDYSSLRLSYAPRTLIGALWLQFALAVVKNKEYPKCENCDQLFEISLDATGRRRDSIFCSPRCKSQDYRKRTRAREMAANGVRLEVIARTLKRDVVKVGAWVNRQDRPRQ